MTCASRASQEILDFREFSASTPVSNERRGMAQLLKREF